MLRSTGLRAMLGRPSAKGLLYLGAAMATHAWFKRARAQRAGRVEAHTPGSTPSMGDDRELAPAATAAPTPDADGHAGVGITDLPTDAEGAQQSSLPPRGTRNEGF